MASKAASESFYYKAIGGPVILSGEGCFAKRSSRAVEGPLLSNRAE